MRIANLEFKEAYYIGSKPDKPSYHINKWECNPYYGNEDKYIREKDYYKHPDIEHFSIHKSCFKNPETSHAVGCFYYDKHEECYNFEFVGDRPLYLTDEERVIFWRLIQHGFNILNGDA